MVHITGQSTLLGPAPAQLQGERHVLIIPEHRLLFCRIEKVACESFQDLFCSLAKHHQTADLPKRETNPLWKTNRGFEVGCSWSKNTAQSLGVSSATVDELFANSSWLKSVFVRDPLERYSFWHHQHPRSHEERNTHTGRYSRRST